MTSSNGNNSDRLDRIEAILESTATLSQQSNQRLDRLEQIAQTTLSIAQKNREDIERTEQLTRRNAAAIARQCSCSDKQFC
jgi:paraquat-inducible protein B